MIIVLIFLLLFSSCTLTAEEPILKIKEYSLVSCSVEEIAKAEQKVKRKDFGKLNDLPNDIRNLFKSTFVLQNRSFNIYGERITAIATSLDNRLLAAGNEDGLVSLWQISEAEDFSPKTYQDQYCIEYISISNDNKYLAYAMSPKDILTVLEIKTMKSVRTIQLRGNLIRVFFDNNSNLITVCALSEDIQLQLWNINDSSNFNLPCKMDCIYDAIMSNDGKYVALGGIPGVIVWDLETRKQYVVINEFNGLVHYLRFSADGKYIIAVNKDFVLKVVDLSTQTIIRTKFIDRIMDIEVSGNDDIIYVTQNMDIKILSIKKGTINNVASNDVGIYKIRIINNAVKTEYVLGCDNGAVRIMNSKDKTFREFGVAYNQLNALRGYYVENYETANVDYIYNNNYFRSAILYDEKSAILTDQKLFFEKGKILDYSERYGLYAIMNDSKLSMYKQKDSNNKEILFELQDSGIQEIFFLFEGKFVGIKMNDNTLQVRNVNGGQKIFELKTDMPVEIVVSLADFIIIGCAQGNIEMYNSKTQSFVSKIKAHDTTITCISVDEKQNLMITADNQGVMKIWKFTNNEFSEDKTIKAHNGKINDVDINSLSDIILTGSDDGEIKLWNLYSYELVYEINEQSSIKDVCLVESTFLCYITADKPVIRTQMFTLSYDIEIEDLGKVEYVDFHDSMIIFKDRSNKLLYYKLIK